jgi:hypothetical protein
VIVMRVLMATRKDTVTEDLAIQETLSMTIEARLELLAALIVDKIALDQKQNEAIYRKITGMHRG